MPEHDPQRVVLGVLDAVYEDGSTLRWTYRTNGTGLIPGKEDVPHHRLQITHGDKLREALVNQPVIDDERYLKMVVATMAGWGDEIPEYPLVYVFVYGTCRGGTGVAVPGLFMLAFDLKGNLVASYDLDEAGEDVEELDEN